MFARRRPLLRAAVVGGGAYLAGKSAARRQADQAQLEEEQNARIGDLEQQAAYQQPAPDQGAPAPAPAPAASSSMVSQLNQLAELQQQGVLTDEEFTAAKAKLLGS